MPPCTHTLFHDCTEAEAYMAARKPVLVVRISIAPARVDTICGVMYARLPLVGS